MDEFVKKLEKRRAELKNLAVDALDKNQPKAAERYSAQIVSIDQGFKEARERLEATCRRTGVQI